jgi:hypothetical protein
MFDPDTSVVSYQTETQRVEDPDRPGNFINVTRQVKDAAGNPVLVAVDRISGRTFKKIADQLPAEDGRKANAILDQKPEHCASPDSRFRGFWVPVASATPSPSDVLAAAGIK